MFRDKDVSYYIAERGHKWTFHVEGAPWWGGAYERMVQSTKQCLKNMVGQASFTHDKLLTAVTEIQCFPQNAFQTGRS